MTLDDKKKLADEAVDLATSAAYGIAAAIKYWQNPGEQGLALNAEDGFKSNARAAAILLETIARE